MNENQHQVIQWWKSGRDFHQGLVLLSKFSKNKVLLHTLSKPGKEKLPAMHTKLLYELPKSVGLDWKSLPVDVQPTAENSLEKPASRALVPQPTIAVQDDLDQYPHIIRKIKYQYADFYKQRSVMHREMCSIPHVNSEGNVLKRAGLLGRVKDLSARMDHLHRFIKDYETSGTIPPEEIVWPAEPELQSARLPDDAAGLRKMKKNYQSANSRDNNLLMYQAKTKAETVFPMSKGPKRIKIEHRIKQRNRVIEQIDNKIIQMEHAD